MVIQPEMAFNVTPACIPWIPAFAGMTDIEWA